MRAAIFDLDGCLIDSMFVWDRLAYDYLRSKGHRPDRDIYKELRDLSLGEASLYLKEGYGLEEDAGVIEDSMRKLLLSYYRERVGLKPGAREILSELRSRGVELALGTAADRDLIEAVFTRLDLGKYFSLVENEASLGLKKTSPDFYRELGRRLGQPREAIWVFEDALYAIRSAKSAGYRVVALEDESNRDQLELIEKEADIYIRNFKDLEVGSLWRKY